jgi:hypothetical protein
MNLTPTRKKLLFAGLVVAFVIIGLAITWPQGKARTGAAPSATPSAAASTPANPVPTASVDPAKFDIYKLLPFDKQEFVSAATTAQSFVAAYGTYRYDESPQAYTNGLKSLSTGDFAKTLNGASGGGMGGQDLKTNQTVSKGSATIASLRDFGASSIIFVVNAHQDITGKNGSKAEDAQYAVTVTQNGSDWQVYDFEPASAGNSGG